ncbi:DUF4236 domain-containing protein [Halomonas aquamarina]|uniref:DUF4236 domain-containing protein n=1 Tax=Vreelandella aquamarina TaxID=77097 RepID=A0ACC5VUE8_9GAMM|nr:DUF4236 domain-containing protein [Halomonas aquamarina]MBZ5487164.1 DUF4236 domain-containing protein [Halomonas aquamarina]
MAWYLRKSVSVGPIRFNLSKSGVGASLGVTGFRIGMRPDGSSYVHAGRHGLYLREEVGGRRGGNQPVSSRLEELPPSQKFDAVSTRDLTSPGRKELIDRLNKSYKDFRLDYFVFVVAVVAFVAALFNGSQLGMAIAGGAGIVFGIAASVFESRRRTVKIFYDFEENDTSLFRSSCRLLIILLNANDFGLTLIHAI